MELTALINALNTAYENHEVELDEKSKAMGALAVRIVRNASVIVRNGKFIVRVEIPFYIKGRTRTHKQSVMNEIFKGCLGKPLTAEEVLENICSREAMDTYCLHFA